MYKNDVKLETFGSIGMSEDANTERITSAKSI